MMTKSLANMKSCNRISLKGVKRNEGETSVESGKQIIYKGSGEEVS